MDRDSEQDYMVATSILFAVMLVLMLAVFVSN